jgi:diacylglycerol kinase family enzyme
MFGSCLLIGNPTAQSGRAAERIERAMHGLERRGLNPFFLATEPGGRTPELVRDLLDRHPFDVAVALGGDGTFAEVARGILSARVLRPMGMLPSGTANDQGRSFGVSSDAAALDDNLDIVCAGHVTRLDAGRIGRVDARGRIDESALFFDSAGFGMQTEILATRNRDRELVEELPLVRHLYRDRAVYAGAAVQEYLASFVDPTKFDADILADGARHHYPGLTDLVIKATAVYAGAWVLAREGEPDDGRFEVVPFQGRRDLFSKALRDLAAIPIWQEDLDELGITHSVGFSGSEFDLRFSRPERPAILAQLDGDLWIAGDHFRITVLKNRLPLITPKDFVPPWRSE